MTKLQPFKPTVVQAMPVVAAVSEDTIKAALSAVTNEDLADIVRLLSKHDNIQIISINSSGLNNPVTGTSGVSVHFRGRTKDKDAEVLTFDDVYWLATHLKTANSYVEGFEVSLSAENSNFVLNFTADATRTS